MKNLNTVLSAPAGTLLRLVLCLGLLCLWQPVGAAGDAFREGGNAYKKGDYETAAKKFLEVAGKGDHRAMYALGSMYAAGNGVPRDYREALKWFSRAAQYGRPDAQYKLGLMYDEGIGVKQNYRRAARWYDRSARQDYPQAQVRLGLLYALGHGVSQNDVRAYAWLMLAHRNLMPPEPAQPPPAVSGEAEAAADADAARDPMADMQADMISGALEEIRTRLNAEQLRAAEQLAGELQQER